MVISSASALALLGLYLLSYHFVSAMRDRHHGDQLDSWTEWWVGLALVGPDEPGQVVVDRRRLPKVAVDSVLSLLEAVKGEEGDRLKESLASHGVDERFLRRARSGHLTARLDAIEGLGKARLPGAFDPLLGLLHHAKPVVRRMAARAAAGTLAIMPPEPGPDSPHARFIHAIKHADLQPGVVQESLLLLETRAGPILRELLADPDLSGTLHWVVLETTGRLGLADMDEQVAASATDPDAELRAAAFRALRRLGTVPESAERAAAGRRRRRGRLRPRAGRPRGRLHRPRPRHPGPGAPPGGRLLVGPPGRRRVAGPPGSGRRRHRQAGRRVASRPGRP